MSRWIKLLHRLAQLVVIKNRALNRASELACLKPLIEKTRALIQSLKQKLRQKVGGRLCTFTAAQPDFVQLEAMEQRLLLSSDLSISSFHADGQLKVNYDIAGQNAQAFDLSVYRSSDGVTLDGLVTTRRIDAGADLTLGSHTSTLTASFTDVQEDYKLIAVIDAAGENAESNETNNTAGFAGGVFVSADSIVHVHGDEGADTIAITKPGNVKVTFNGTLYQYAASSVSAIHIRTHGGDDVMNAGTGVNKSIWVFGGIGADDLTGGASDDYIDGGAGNDILTGRTGDDVIEGRDGDDIIVGDAGNDILRGGDGNDNIDGQENNDLIEGGAGNDILRGGNGSDTIDGGDGDDDIEGNENADIIMGGLGNDTIDGGTGADTIDGGAGHDIIYGSEDPDLIYGGDGNDVIDAGYGHDVVYGGDGDDIISGKAGGDTLYGEAGNDILDGDSGTNTLDGGKGIDTFDGVTESNTAPLASGIVDVGADEDATLPGVDLKGVFEDAEHFDGELVYTVVGNSNPSLVSSATVDAFGVLSVILAADAWSNSQLTIRATDPLGLYAETSFTVNVAAVNDAPIAVSPDLVQVSEDGAATAIDLHALFADVDDADGTRLRVTLGSERLGRDSDYRWSCLLYTSPSPRD